MILLFINIVVIIAVLSTLGSGEDFGGAFQAALFILFVLALFDIFVAIPIWKAMLGKDDAPSTPAPLVMSGTMRCPTCGADAEPSTGTSGSAVGAGIAGWLMLHLL